ncbi:MAG TPA: carbon starvation CstA family protein, partial [Nitrospiraceae bacterium]|nr:carbon starvation CstA family protein [Nitrospiraceae bacterium]
MFAWALVAVLCAVAFGFVTGLFSPNEKVNGLWLVVAASCFYVLALRFYGRFLARRVLELNDQHVTPACRLNDGTNFYPT